MNAPVILRDPAAMRAWAQQQKQQGQRIALVPTMGYLHEAHLSLVTKAKQHASRVVASIFVNPTQFAPTEDLATYPRDTDGDIAKLTKAGVDAIFIPEPSAMYRDGFDTYVVPTELARHLCGASRPVFFRGVCTVVTLLFRMSLCDVAVFGEKDFQQLQIIRRMTSDLWLDVDIVGAPIDREADGLAMSSRNAYLHGNARQEALVLSKALKQVHAAFERGETKTSELIAQAHDIIATAPSARVDYINIVDVNTMQPIDTITDEAVCALAVWIGSTRLIDNQVLGSKSGTTISSG